MRELKFRAWDRVKKVMIHNLISWGIREDGTTWTAHSNEFNKETGYLWHPSNIDIEQFTGLTDKNGKEIYEGDLVIFTNQWGGEFVDEIVFHNGAFYHGKNFEHCDLLCNMDESMLEVVGNINEQEEK